MSDTNTPAATDLEANHDPEQPQNEAPPGYEFQDEPNEVEEEDKPDEEDELLGEAEPFEPPGSKDDIVGGHTFDLGQASSTKRNTPPMTFMYD